MGFFIFIIYKQISLFMFINAGLLLGLIYDYDISSYTNIWKLDYFHLNKINFQLQFVDFVCLCVCLCVIYIYVYVSMYICMYRPRHKIMCGLQW